MMYLDVSLRALPPAHQPASRLFQLICSSAARLSFQPRLCNGWHSTPTPLREGGGVGVGVAVTVNVNTCLFPLQVWWHSLLAFEV